MDQIIDNNLTTNKLINDIRNNELNFSTNIVDTIKLPVPVGLVNILKGKKSCEIHVARLACLWESSASDSMIKKVISA